MAEEEKQQKKANRLLVGSGGDKNDRLRAFTSGVKKQMSQAASIGSAQTAAAKDMRILVGPLGLDYLLGGGLKVGWNHSFYGKKSGGKTTSAKRAVSACQKVCRNCYRPAQEIVAVPPPKDVLEEDPDARWSAKGKCDCYKLGIYQPDPPEIEPKEKKKDYKARVEAWDAALKKNSYEEFICAWVDMENAYEADYASKLGIDNRRLLWMRPESAEAGLDIVYALGMTMACDLMVIDSIAHLVPLAELAASTAEWQQGLQARLMNKGARMLVRAGSANMREKRAFTQIWINQEREKIGVMFGDKNTKPGGKGQEFAVHVEIKFNASKRKVSAVQYGSKEDVVSVPVEEQFNFTCTKNRTESVASCNASYRQQMREVHGRPVGTLIEDEDIHKMTLHWIAETTENKTYRIGNEEFSTQREILEKIRKDPQFKAVLKYELLQRQLKAAG